MIKHIAVVEWAPGDGIARTIRDELIQLDYSPVLFQSEGNIPDNVDMVLTFAPYGKLLPIMNQLAKFTPQNRPIYVHWNTENPPDPSLPWTFIKQIAAFRSWVDRLSDSPKPFHRYVANLKPIQWLRGRMYRFRYIGDYHYAYVQGWLDLLAEFSNFYTQLHTAHGMPAIFVPWGTSPAWYANLNLERDIDVLWFGQRRTKRRSLIIDTIRHQLRNYGIEMYVADGVENPFIYDDERTNLLNRTKITLSLLTNRYESVFPHRFHMAAGNKCMVISEPEYSHHPDCIAAKHFVAATAAEIVSQILYFLSHEDERIQITENAYQLVTQKLTLANSLKAIIRAAENKQRVGQNQVTIQHQKLG
jgi:hypothetical protein